MSSKPPCFFLKQLLINICVNSDQKIRSSSGDTYKDDTKAEADTLAVWCDDVTVWHKVATNASYPPNDADTPACVCCPKKHCRF